MQVHHVITVRDLGEIERLVLAAQAHQPLLLPQRAQGLVTPENFGVAQDDQFARRPDEAAQQRTQKERNCFDRDLRLGENFLQSLLFALVVAEDCHFPLLGEPVAQVIEEKFAPIFLQNEIAARRMEKVVREEGQVIGWYPSPSSSGGSPSPSSVASSVARRSTATSPKLTSTNPCGK